MQSADYTLLDAVRVALIEPTHPGNIGAAARAMANMGLRDLALVNPREFPSPQATARAAGADAVLENATVSAGLDEAIAECALVVGASARLRSVEWPELSPAEAMRKVAAAAAAGERAAVLFGRESRGLTNRELDRCHYLVRIPANPDFSSLNLAAAVLLLCYELRLAAGELVGDRHSHSGAGDGDDGDGHGDRDGGGHGGGHSHSDGDDGDGGVAGDGAISRHPHSPHPRHPRSPHPRHPRSPHPRHPRSLLSGGGDIHPRHPRSLLSGGGDGECHGDGHGHSHSDSDGGVASDGALSRHPRSLLSGGGDGEGHGVPAGHGHSDSDDGDGGVAGDGEGHGAGHHHRDRPHPDSPAVAAEMQHFYRHLRAVVAALEFGNGRSEKLHRKLTRLFNRARPTNREIRTLRGLLSAIERQIGARN